MAINLKAKETLIQVGELKGKYRYVLSTELYNKLPESKVIKEAALQKWREPRRDAGMLGCCRRGNQGMVYRRPLRRLFQDWEPCRFGVRAKSVDTVSEVASGLITARTSYLHPKRGYQGGAAGTPIQITCYRPQRQGGEERYLWR